jgi:hypothetical protein
MCFAYLFQTIFGYFLGGCGERVDWGLNWEPYTCKVGTLPLKPHLQSILLWSFFGDGVSRIICPKFSPPVVCLTSPRLTLLARDKTGVWAEHLSTRLVLCSSCSFEVSVETGGSCEGLWEAEGAAAPGRQNDSVSFPRKHVHLCVLAPEGGCYHRWPFQAAEVPCQVLEKQNVTSDGILDCNSGWKNIELSFRGF